MLNLYMVILGIGLPLLLLGFLSDEDAEIIHSLFVGGAPARPKFWHLLFSITLIPGTTVLLLASALYNFWSYDEQ